MSRLKGRSLLLRHMITADRLSGVARLRERTRRFNVKLNAIVVDDLDRARTRARAADAAIGRKETWGPLHGLPISVKESFDIVGLPTTWGIPGLKDNCPSTNAVAVDRLLDAGAHFCQN